MADSIKPLTDEQRAVLNEVSRVDWAFSAYRLVGECYQIRAARDGWIANGKKQPVICVGKKKKNNIGVSFVELLPSREMAECQVDLHFWFVIASARWRGRKSFSSK